MSVRDFGTNTYFVPHNQPDKFRLSYSHSQKVMEHIIKEHGGEFWLEQDGNSSTFHFTIPIAKDTND